MHSVSITFVVGEGQGLNSGLYQISQTLSIQFVLLQCMVGTKSEGTSGLAPRQTTGLGSCT